ncbi:GNAT family N-acetyltransferase [Oceanirhabdus sp. W0125-5]|uniref:GNAT family N-acetyltransferase n=1 Tax=Oceanirhabdus sp. W0125-5 TaxID=2999116 RepID=UPI0022F2BDE0|nr:GNAT family N-acetyltransferase [Oceanirhabdus sp. W0125-5]WBW97335.1 GNAT family N-acetyltransferase [Oceanirhabdus sp. W0125-5]
MVYLKELSLNDGQEILDMIREIGPGENGFGNSGWDMKDEEFEWYLRRNIRMAQGIGLEPHLVPETMYWLYVDDRPVGIIKLRPILNQNLRKLGGNIGYCIRPSERGKGYGVLILKEMMKKVKARGMSKVLLTVNEDNIASRKVIESNEGELYDIIDGKCRYWINVY